MHTYSYIHVYTVCKHSLLVEVEPSVPASAEPGRDGDIDGNTRGVWQKQLQNHANYYMRNLLGWLETRLAQHTFKLHSHCFNYLEQ